MLPRPDDILAPLGADAFFADCAGRQPVHLTGAPPSLALPDWGELAELLNKSALWSAETLVVLERGEPVDAERYCEAATDRDLLPTQRPIAERVRALQAGGAVVVAHNVETLVPSLKRIASTLEASFGARVNAELQVHRAPSTAPAGAVALADILILPLAGAIRVRVRPGVAEHPVQHPKFAARADIAGAPAPTLATDPVIGERVYLPRGSVYEIDAASDDVAVVLFTILRPVGLDLMRALGESAVDEPFFRTDVPRAEADRQAYLAEFARRVGALATGPQGLAALIQIDQGFRRDLGEVRLPEDGPATGTHYRRNATRLEVVETPAGWQLRAARGAVPIPVGREQLVAWIVARPEFTDDQLKAAFPGADADLVVALLRDLLAMKVIVPA
jgi:hypothetical protein